MLSYKRRNFLYNIRWQIIQCRTGGFDTWSHFEPVRRVPNLSIDSMVFNVPRSQIKNLIYRSGPMKPF